MSKFNELCESVLNEANKDVYVKDNGMVYVIHRNGDSILTAGLYDTKKRLRLEVTRWLKSSLKDSVRVIDHQNKFEEPEKGKLAQHGFQVIYDDPKDHPKDVKKEYEKIAKVIEKEIAGEYEHFTYLDITRDLSKNKISLAKGTLPGISHEVKTGR
jgi:hypothetical protein